MIENLPAMQETLVQSLGLADSLKEGMATHSSILAWKIPWTEEPGGLQSMGLQRVGHNRATAHMAPCIRFTLEQESQGQRSLVGWRLWGRTESDTTEAT